MEGSLSEELRKLADLRDDGILTNEEFETAKKRILGERQQTMAGPPAESSVGAPSGGPPSASGTREVLVKKYRNTAAANRDAKRMAVQGWEPESTAGGGTRFAPGHGLVNKGIASAALGPIGLFASSRKEVEINITWMRTPEAAADNRERIAAMLAKVESGGSLSFGELQTVPGKEYRAARKRYKEAKARETAQPEGGHVQEVNPTEPRTISVGKHKIEIVDSSVGPAVKNPFGPSVRRARREAKRSAGKENVQSRTTAVICRRCGAELSEAHKRCFSCGSPVE